MPACFASTTTLRLRSELPPRSKKFSSTPTLASRRMRCQAVAIARSVAVRGSVRGRVSARTACAGVPRASAPPPVLSGPRQRPPPARRGRPCRSASAAGSRARRSGAAPCSRAAWLSEMRRRSSGDADAESAASGAVVTKATRRFGAAPLFIVAPLPFPPAAVAESANAATQHSWTAGCSRRTCSTSAGSMR